MEPMMNSATQGLARFIEAQDRVYESVCNELALGEKTGHWMWFIFPQFKELGRSAIAKHYGLDSAAEALAYWQHPVLGARLLECTQLVMAQQNTTAHDIFGSPDDLKFKSCMTLFSQVAREEPRFKQALARFFGGLPDESTLKLLV
jgi:uncharacterized protein (DUF1810 family)